MRWRLILAVCGCLACCPLGPARGQDFLWTRTPAPEKPWQFVTSSADGRFLMAAVYGQGNEIFLSADGGQTWVPTTVPPVAQWSAGATSADGGTLFAAVGAGVPGAIYRSQNGGATWMPTPAPILSWWSLAASADGSRIGANAAGGGVYLGTNGGVSWQMASLDPGSYALATSADGAQWVAARQGGRIFLSRDAGLSWTASSAPSNQWRSVVASADGKRLFAAVQNGGIFGSVDGGGKWTQTAAPQGGWFRLAASSDGKVVAALQPSGIHTSKDGGRTWQPGGQPAASPWWTIAASADGTRLVAAVQHGGIYTAQMRTNLPFILDQPVVVAACEGDPVALPVEVGGTPPLTFQWRKDGNLLADGEGVQGSRSDRLVLLAVTSPDEGHYDLVVGNSAGSVTSAPVSVVIGPVSARAVPIVVNGFVVGATLTHGGCGYTAPAAVVFTGGNGVGGSGYAEVLDGTVTGIVVTNAGVGYPADALAVVAPPRLPAVSLGVTNTPPAQVQAVVTNGFLVGAKVLFPGAHYAEPPAVRVIDEVGQGASVSAEIDDGAVTNVVVVSAGFGYTPATRIEVAPAGDRNAVVPGASQLLVGQKYQLTSSQDGIAWEDQGPPFMATNSVWLADESWVIETGSGRFFRLRIPPP